MLNPLNEKNEPDGNQMTSVNIQQGIVNPTETPISALAEKVPIGLEQLIEEEKALTSEKRHLLEIVEELENRLSIEIERRRSAINSLRTEVSDLQKTCEVLANALEIPVMK